MYIINVAENYRVDLTVESSMRTVLRFNKKVNTAGYDESESLVNILKVNILRVTRDIIGA